MTLPQHRDLSPLSPSAEYQRCLSRSDLVAEVNEFLEKYVPADDFDRRCQSTGLLSLFCCHLMRDIPQ